jgi:choline dehydrogenase-like flavoprotein
MFIDGNSIPNDQIVETDLCIIGGGAAGITIARELAGKPFKVALVESGGLEYDDENQKLLEGTQIGIKTDNPAENRLRYFGGTTNHWIGYCRPLDKEDFEKRDWVPDSGWPISLKDLIPFYKRAHKVCQIPDVNYSTDYWLKHVDNSVYKKIPIQGQFLETVSFMMSPPTRFGKVYKKELETSSNIAIYINSNATDIIENRNKDAVVKIKCKTLAGNEYWIKSKYFVLALGAIENSRIMLANNIGNEFDLVGRYFMQHPSDRMNRFMPSNPELPLEFYDIIDTHTNPIFNALAFKKDVIADHKMLNHSIYFSTRKYRWEGALETLKKIYRSFRYFNPIDDVREDIPGLISDIDSVFDPIRLNFSDVKSPTEYVEVYYRPEQSPNPNSRITLGKKLDNLGMPKIVMDWRFNELDLHTQKTGHELLARELGQSGLGRLRTRADFDDAEWPYKMSYEFHGGHHHMGTTRMHDSPKKGVVNSQGRVHGSKNLYVSGSSVFPTSGISNPTLTIVALALRLADNLAGKLN